MTFTGLEKGLGAFVVILLGASAVEGWRLRRAEGRAGQLALAADTLKAHADTSHRLILAQRDSLKLLGDSLSGVQRRVVQVAQRADALDKALKEERIALSELTAQVRSLSVRLASTGNVVTDTASGTRSAHFDVDTVPYKGTADVSLPRTGPGTLNLHISLPPAPIGLRLGCGAAVDGIRPATATATGPPWLTLALGRVEQSPDLCRSPALQTTDSRGWFRRIYDRFGVDVGYGFTDVGGKIYVGPQAGVSVKIWP